jgi:hypothetical protein
MLPKKKPDRWSVFLNVPFDADYEPLFVGLIASLVAIGRKPRCVLELPEQGQGRLFRLFNLIWVCPVSIHDLSRVKPPPRFNMPFELGLAVAFFRLGKKRQFVMLEEKKFRLQRTLSDLNGYDPGIHGDTIKGVIGCVLSHLGRPTGNPLPLQVKRLFHEVWKSVPLLKRNYGRKSIFARPIFADLILVASKFAEAEGLIAS